MLEPARQRRGHVLQAVNARSISPASSASSMRRTKTPRSSSQSERTRLLRGRLPSHHDLFDDHVWVERREARRDVPSLPECQRAAARPETQADASCVAAARQDAAGPRRALRRHGDRVRRGFRLARLRDAEDLLIKRDGARGVAASAERFRRVIGACRIFCTTERASSSTAACCSGVIGPRRRRKRSNFRPAHLQQPLAQRLDRRTDLQQAAPALERLDLRGQNQRAVSAARWRSSRLTSTTPCKSSNVVQVNVVEAVDRGVDVARHGDIDEEQRPSAPRSQHFAHRSRCQTTMPGAPVPLTTMSTRRAVRTPRPSGSRRRPAARRCTAERWKVRLATVIAHARGGQVARRQLGHLARSEQQRLAAGRGRRRSCAPARPRRTRSNTACLEIPVSVRARLAAASPCCNSRSSSEPVVPAARATRYACLTWPRICGSPRIIESRPAATSNRWRTASLPA